MKENSVQTQAVSDSTETIKENVEVNADQTVTDDVVQTMPDGYKNDFFKQKQKMKDAQTQRDEALAKVAEFEEKENLAKGNFQTIIDTLKEENKGLKDNAAKSVKKEQYNTFNSKLQAKAREMGFTKPEKILSFVSDKDMELLKIDQEMNIDDAGMNAAFQNIKKEWGELFKPKEIKIADGAPKTNLNEAPKKTAKQMTSAERMAAVIKLNKEKK